MALSNVLNKNKKNTTATYEQWAVDAENNARIENSDQTPSATSNFWRKWNMAVGSAVQGAASGAGLDSKYGVAAPVKETPKLPESPYRENMASLGVPTSSLGAFSKWSPTNQSQPTNVSTPPATGEQKEEVKTTPAPAPVTDESGFSKWLATDPEMQARMRAAETDYYKNLSTYGAQGEALAQSGLIGSGWSEYLKGNAYSAMQAEKAGVRSEGYAKWLADNEAKAPEGTVSEQSAAIVNTLLENGMTEITDSYAQMLAGLGYSTDDINQAKESLAKYTESMKAEESKKHKTAVETLISGGSEADFLTSMGIDYSGLDEDGVTKATDEAIEAAYKNGTLDEATRSAYYKATMILDEDMTGWSIGKTADAASGSVESAGEYLKEGKITENDYKQIVDAAYNALGISKIEISSSASHNETLQGSQTDDIVVYVNVRGKQRKFIFNTTGHGNITKSETLDVLNSNYGDSVLAAHEGNHYYQYKPGKWMQIGVTAGSKGTKDEGNDILRVVAQYVSDKKLKVHSAVSNTVTHNGKDYNSYEYYIA